MFGWVVRRDEIYEAQVQRGMPKSGAARVLYLLLYFAPGVVVYLLINTPPVYHMIIALTGLKGKAFQYLVFIAVTFGWHMALPVALLRWNEKLSFREVASYIGIDRVNWTSLLVFMPIAFALFVAVSIPYMHYLGDPLTRYLYAQAWSTIPPWSIFQPGPDSMFTFSPILLLPLFIGNFVGEELYYRGYLMKKTAWLGGWNWLANSLLFALYHIWQIPQTWPIAGLILVFGGLMQLRKDYWSMVMLHLLVNLAWSPIMLPLSARVFH